MAARQRSPETRRTYAAVYRRFGAFLGPQVTPNDLTPEALFVTMKTAEAHLGHVYRKLDIASRRELPVEPSPGPSHEPSPAH